MPGAIFLKGEGINLRTVEEEDLEFIRDTYNHPEVWPWLTHRGPQNLKQEREFFENVVCSDDEINLAISVDEEMVGLISLIPREEESVAEIGIWIYPDHHGSGYGTEASRLMVDYGFNHLGYHKIIAKAMESNKGSRGIWKKLGFEKEGEHREEMYRDKKYRDVYYYGILEDEWR